MIGLILLEAKIDRKVGTKAWTCLFARNIKENAGLNYHATSLQFEISTARRATWAQWVAGKIRTPGYPLYNLTPGAEVLEM